MSLTIEEIKQRLAHLSDPEELVDVLEISIEELTDAFEDKIWDFATLDQYILTKRRVKDADERKNLIAFMVDASR